MSFRSFSPKQKTVLTWWLPGSRHYAKEAIVCDGAVRSGKTLAMGLSFFLWAMTVFDHQRFGICGKTIASLRRNVLGEILPKLEELGECSFSGKSGLFCICVQAKWNTAAAE